MQGLQQFPNDVVHLDLTPSSPPPTPATATATAANITTGMGGGGSGGFSIDDEESTDEKIRRLISEHPVIIFSRSSCYMCHVMKKLLATIGVHPTVIALEDHEIAVISTISAAGVHPPAIFIGGDCVGGLESLVALHLSGHLVPKLVEVGALWV